MRQVRNIVLRRNDLRGRLQCSVGISVVAYDQAGLCRGCLHLLSERHGIIAGVRAFIPDELEFLAAHDCRPGVARHHGDAAHRHELGRPRPALNLDDLLDAGNLECLGRIERYQLAADDRWTGNDSELHPGDLGIDAICCMTDSDVMQIDDWNRASADIAELARVLQLQRLHCGYRQCARCVGEFAVAEHVARLQMNHLVIFGLHRRYIDAPAFRRRLLQHHAHRGTALAHRLHEMASAARAVSILVAVFLLVTGSLLHAHLRPVSLHLVGDHHGQAGAHAGAHLGPVGEDGDQT